MQDREQDIPLCVDLDGTLLRSDLLLESALALLRHNPLYAFCFLFWLARGKANLKRQIAQRARLDVGVLPYDPRVLGWLRESGQRRRILCTAADGQLAEAVAAHIGGFEATLASDGERNLVGRHKADALRQRYGEQGFDYAGNAAVDLHVWRHARRAIVVNAARSLLPRVRALCQVERVFERGGGRLRAWLAALRLHQWPKNLLVFVPLLAAHQLLNPAAALSSVIAFFAFSLCASGAYVLNDLLDLDADRRHPRKCKRPFATGKLPIAAGLVAVPLLTLAAFAIASLLPLRFVLVLLAYGVATLTYSLLLKRIAMLDVVTLAALYTIRIVGGAVAIPVPASSWLLAFAMFLFLGLALVKRYIELLRVSTEQGGGSVAGRGYHVTHLRPVWLCGLASGMLTLLVLAFYIDSTKSALLYREPHLLWLLLPLLGFWLARTWHLARRGRMHDDPLVFALTDKVSFAVLAVFAAVVVLAI